MEIRPAEKHLQPILQSQLLHEPDDTLRTGLIEVIQCDHAVLTTSCRSPAYHGAEQPWFNAVQDFRML
jgi:hypothetical protein